MGRKRLGPRLYFDPARKRWTIREDHTFIRTRYREYQTDLARAALWRFIRRRNRRLLGRVVYFVTCEVDGFPIKIGMSLDLEERLRDLATSLPYPIKLLGAIPGTSATEAAIQRRWAALRLKGEWFQRTPELMAFISDEAIVYVPFACRVIEQRVKEVA